MKCPSCNGVVVNFWDWYGGKCYKAECQHCQSNLVANVGTKLSIAILILLLVVGGLGIVFSNPEAFSNNDKTLIFYFLLYAILFVIPCGFVLYNKVCGYVVKIDT
jgi:hypothetical protein